MISCVPSLLIHFFIGKFNINLYYRIFMYFCDYKNISLFYSLLYLFWICIHLSIILFFYMELALMHINFIGLDLNFTGDFLYMENCENNSNFDSSAGKNSLGGAPGGGAPGGGPGYENEVASVTAADGSNRVRPSNPMSLTQMCNGTSFDYLPEESPQELSQPLSIDSLKRVHDVLYSEQHEYWKNNPSWNNRAVTMTKLGYNFLQSKGTVISELKVLKNTNSEFYGLGAQTNVDKVILYCRKNM